MKEQATKKAHLAALVKTICKTMGTGTLIHTNHF